MTIHISARIAWHDNGWNGHICKNPRANTYEDGGFDSLAALAIINEYFSN